MADTAGTPTVFVIDDDANVRAAIAGLLKYEGLLCETFGTAQEFLRKPQPARPSCLVLDMRLPGMNGLDVQRELAAAGVKIPIIFITRHGDIPMTVFFFQAEDGIRDLYVTGVQTCALPI